MFDTDWPSLRGLMKRGSIKLLIMHVLGSKPMHGYEVAKEIASIFDGGYEPSPGVIYPTLQWLEDQGYVEGTNDNGKTVYAITDAGRTYLKGNEERLTKIVRFVQEKTNAYRGFPIRKSAARLQRTIFIYLPEMSDERRVEVARILDDANERIARLMEG